MSEPRVADRRSLDDEDLDRRLDEFGYVTIPLLPADEVAALRRWYRDRAPATDRGIVMDYTRADRSYMADVRARLAPVWERHLLPHLAAYRVVVSSFVVKHPGEGTGMAVHDDRTYVDERRHRAVMLWVPLVDTDHSNGGLAVVPRSHRLVDTLSGTGVPDWWDPVMPTMTQALNPLTVAAGTGVLYDTRLLHGSPPNTSGEVREAVVCVCVPDDVDVLHVVATSASGRRVHVVDEGFFVDRSMRDLRAGDLGDQPVLFETEEGTPTLDPDVLADIEAVLPQSGRPGEGLAPVLADVRLERRLDRDGCVVVGHLQDEALDQLVGGTVPGPIADFFTGHRVLGVSSGTCRLPPAIEQDRPQRRSTTVVVALEDALLGQGRPALAVAPGAHRGGGGPEGELLPVNLRRGDVFVLDDRLPRGPTGLDLPFHAAFAAVVPTAAGATEKAGIDPSALEAVVDVSAAEARQAMANGPALMTDEAMRVAGLGDARGPWRGYVLRHHYAWTALATEWFPATIDGLDLTAGLRSVLLTVVEPKARSRSPWSPPPGGHSVRVGIDVPEDGAALTWTGDEAVPWARGPSMVLVDLTPAEDWNEGPRALVGLVLHVGPRGSLLRRRPKRRDRRALAALDAALRG